MYKGDSKDLLRKNLDDRATAYCGLQNLLLDGRTCEFQMSPFWPTYVGIKDGQGDICLLHAIHVPWEGCWHAWKFGTHFPNGQWWPLNHAMPLFYPGCSLKSKVEFSLPMLLSGIAGRTRGWAQA